MPSVLFEVKKNPMNYLGLLDLAVLSPGSF